MGDAPDLERLVAKVEALQSMVRDQRRRVDELEAENDVLRQEMRDLQDEVADASQLRSMLQPDEDEVRMTKDRRAAIVLARLYEDATDSDGIAAADYDAVWNILQRNISESYASQIMRHVPTLVGDESVCWVAEEARNDTQNTRVILDLQHGAEAVPHAEEGVRIRGGVSADD